MKNNFLHNNKVINYIRGDTVEKEISDWKYLRQIITNYRKNNQTIVFTNGCFDILHRGHVTYLKKAKRLGDVLIIGVNSDGSVKRLKGHSRPINTLDDRMGVLSALGCVDHVISFEEDSPTKIIEIIKPDIYAKGGDYTVESLPEAPLIQELGGEIRILPYLNQYSTTKLLQQIHSSFETINRNIIDRVHLSTRHKFKP